LSGGLPFAPNVSVEELIAIKRAGFEAIEQMSALVPASIKSLIHWLLAPQLSRRLGNAAALAERLRTLYFETLHGKADTTAGDVARGSETLSDDVPLVGRDQELAKVRAAVAAVRSGEGRALLVTGDPGIGKSRLVGEALQ